MNDRSWEEWYGAVEASYLDLQDKVATTIVGGESMGALLTLLLANRQSGIKGLLCYSPALIIPKICLSHLLLPFVRQYPKGGKEDFLPWKGYTVNPVHAITELHKLQKHVRKILPGITTPIAIFQSKRDTSIDPHGAEVLYGNVGSRDKELHWFNESSHCMILDKQLDEIYITTKQFLSRIK
jgi:carboxylesterase